MKSSEKITGGLVRITGELVRKTGGYKSESIVMENKSIVTEPKSAGYSQNNAGYCTKKKTSGKASGKQFITDGLATDYSYKKENERRISARKEPENFGKKEIADFE